MMGSSFHRTFKQLLVLGLVPAATAVAATTYVDDDTCPAQGAGSALDPWCSIQHAIDVCTSGDLIWVAPGTYNETIDFAGKALTVRSSGGPQVTILDASGLNDTAVRCVSGEGSNTVLWGLTITGGSGELSTGRGGGMLNENGSSATVRDCTFTGNSATFVGGAMFNDASSPSMIDCRFVDNTAGYLGGGVASFFSGPSFSGCRFSGNTVNGAGGGIYNEGHPSPTFTFCTVIDNAASIGAGMYNNDSSPTLIGCRLLGNHADLDGGAIANASSGAALINTVLSGNTAGDRGGALQTEALPVPTIVNCTFVANSGPAGGAIHSSFNTDLVIANSILWNNGPTPIVEDAAITTVNHSDIQGGWSGSGSYNIDTDPLFADADGPDDIAGTDDDDLRLQPGSPCLDAGNNAAVPADTLDLDGDGDIDEPIPIDADGLPRFVDDPDAVDCPQQAGACGAAPIVDIGAPERQVDEPCPADLNGDDTVDAADLAVLLGNWGPAAGHPADFNGDGTVDATDLAALLGNWGACQ